MNKYFIAFLLGYFLPYFENLSVYFIKRKWRRQCNYDCTKCHVWDCDYHYCRAQKLKDITKMINKIRKKEKI